MYQGLMRQKRRVQGSKAFGGVSSFRSQLARFAPAAVSRKKWPSKKLQAMAITSVFLTEVPQFTYLIAVGCNAFAWMLTTTTATKVMARQTTTTPKKAPEPTAKAAEPT
jgi:hypothetical protein